jgi:hypothetical protein
MHKRIKKLISAVSMLGVLGFSLQASSAWAEFSYLKVNIIDFTDANESNQALVAGAVELIEQVVNTNSFRDQVLNMTYQLNKNGKVYPGFTQNTETNEEVLSKILRAKEIYDGGSEGVIDYFLDMYYTTSRVIGYTSPTDRYIHLNRRYYKNYTSVQATANLFHEWLHKIGFKHSQKRNKFRPHSVPYKLGYLVGDMAAEIAAKGDPIQQAEFKSEFLKSLDEPCEENQ